MRRRGRPPPQEQHAPRERRIEALAAERGLPVVGGSDAHFPFEVGPVSTRLDVERLTPETVVAAVRAGRVEPVFHEGPLLWALGSGYRRIHGPGYTSVTRHQRTASERGRGSGRRHRNGARTGFTESKPL